ncbi:PAS domain-containing protein [Halorhabdus rudnickae]|uniref:PAS domain-containing protein n=1 Tax=Halorhabdus rudnickae TaxID=1775544 RepID=UPI001082989C|nr:PAS domain S-box protein [Halorhabdus rudnickae]
MPQSLPEYETIFNAAEDAIFLCDVTETSSGYEFEFRRVNPSLEAISGLSFEDCRGASPREVLGDEQGAEVTANLRKCVDLREMISYEEVLEMPAGTIHWQTKLSPVIRDKEVVQIVGIARDITEQKAREEALRRARKRLDLALEATETGVWEWNMETDEVVWNDALERLVGIEPRTFEGTYEAHAEYLHPNAVSRAERALADALEADETFEAEFRMIRDDGDTIWVLSGSVQIRIEG